MALQLPQLTVSGTRSQMGQQYGAHFRELIHAFVDNRVAAVTTYLANAGHAGTEELFKAGAACLEVVKTFDPAGYEEHLGIAEGAELDPVRLFTTANMTDVRDVIILPGDPIVTEDEGCTAALIPAEKSASGKALQGQTWDLNGPDVEYVVAIHSLPDDGPETWSVTCAGCQTLMGMNEYGVSVGTTNLKTYGAKVGVPYLSLLHAALRQRSLPEASKLFETTQVAGSHSYWVGDMSHAVEWERTPDTAHSRSTLDGEAVVRTNHCLVDSNSALETDLSPSTFERFARIKGLVEGEDRHTLKRLKQHFANREDGRLSINRRLEDDSGATTNAVVAMDGANRTFLACRGRADQGEWVQLEFERAPALA
ncbi:MAG: C45 family peptidase [Pseudomonadota bacterium]